MEVYTLADRALAIFLLSFSNIIIASFVFIATPPIALFVVTTDMIYTFLLFKLNLPDFRGRRSVIESVVKFYYVSWFTWKVIMSLIFCMWNGSADTC